MFFSNTFKKTIATTMLAIICLSILSVAFSYRFAGSAGAAELPLEGNGLLINLTEKAETIVSDPAATVHTTIALIPKSDLPEDRAELYVNGTYLGLCTADGAAEALQDAKQNAILQNYGAETDKPFKPDGVKLGGGKRPDENNGILPTFSEAPLSDNNPPTTIATEDFPPLYSPTTYSAVSTSAFSITPDDGFTSLPSSA